MTKSYIMLAYVEEDGDGNLKTYPYPLSHYEPETHRHLYRLLDADGGVLGYGLADTFTFDPKDDYEEVWGAAGIEYFYNETWEEL